MKKDDLLLRITKKEDQIEKIKKRISKWEKQCSQDEINIAKEYKDNYSNFVKECKERNIGYSFTPASELRSALNDLDQANTQLYKYKNQLNIIVDRESQEKIPALVEFFNNYRKQVINYIENNVEHLEKYYVLNKERVEMRNNRHRYLQEMSQEEYDEKINRLKYEEEEEYDLVHPITRECFYRGELNYDELNKILDKDIDAKYWNMIERVTKVTGEIIDASALSIAGDGNINGIIAGKESKAKLETILAGGYNQNIIVNVRKGQILHYRLLVNRI